MSRRTSIHIRSIQSLKTFMLVHKDRSCQSRSSTRGERLKALVFVVVQIDGMGTNNRSKAFHDVAWKNLKDAGFQ